MADTRRRRQLSIDISCQRRRAASVKTVQTTERMDSGRTSLSSLRITDDHSVIVECLEHGRRDGDHHCRRRDVGQPHRQEPRHAHEPERDPIVRQRAATTLHCSLVFSLLTTRAMPWLHYFYLL